MQSSTTIKDHLKQLFFKKEEEYCDWCTQNGFPTSFPKTIHLLNYERKLRSAQLFSNSMKETRKLKTFKALVQHLKENKKIRLENIKISFVQDLSCLLNNLETARKWGIGDFYLDCLVTIDKVSKLIKNNYFFEIFNVVLNHERWLRKLEEWKPKSHNPQKQFSSLARYLLTKYDVPLFMDSVWTNQNNMLCNETYQEWFIFLGNGGNIGKAKDLPIPLTKKQAHYFLKAPDNYSVNHAFRYAQIISEGGTERLANAFKETRAMVLDKDRNNFCLSVIKFFINNPMLDLVHVGPIVDYIWNEKYTQTVNGIPQPNFSMNGRTPESLLNAVERWHRQLGKEKKGGNQVWERCKIKEFEVTFGSVKRNTLRVWKIIELCSAKELATEGRSQKHCVSSYTYSCAKRQCAIFSLRCFTTDTDFEIKTTIEVRNNTIYQMRDKYNKLPTTQELDIILQWASREGLKRV